MIGQDLKLGSFHFRINVIIRPPKPRKQDLPVGIRRTRLFAMSSQTELSWDVERRKPWLYDVSKDRTQPEPLRSKE